MRVEQLDYFPLIVRLKGKFGIGAQSGSSDPGAIQR